MKSEEKRIREVSVNSVNNQLYIFRRIWQSSKESLYFRLLKIIFCYLQSDHLQTRRFSDSLMARIFACHARDPSSILGLRDFFAALSLLF